MRTTIRFNISFPFLLLPSLFPLFFLTNKTDGMNYASKQHTISWEKGLTPMSLHCVTTMVWSWSILLWKISLCESNESWNDAVKPQTDGSNLFTFIVNFSLIVFVKGLGELILPDMPVNLCIPQSRYLTHQLCPPPQQPTATNKEER